MAIKQRSPKSWFRPGLLVVWRANPRWFRGLYQSKGWWFTLPAPNTQLESVFKNFNVHRRTKKESSHRFYRWDEQGFWGWWTASESSATSAAELLKVRGWDLSYLDRNPVTRRHLRPEPPDPSKTRWSGDYTTVRRGLLALLTYPLLKDTDRKWVTGWGEHLQRHGWLSETHIDNLRKLIRRPYYRKWLRQQGYLRRERRLGPRSYWTAPHQDW